MEQEVKKYRNKKIVLTVLHILFVLAAAAGFSAMYLSSDFGKGISWLQSVDYEDTEQFHLLLSEDIDKIFTYIGYKDVFETDGELDLNKVIVGVNDGPGLDEVLTLDDIIRYAKRRGYYLDENFTVKGSPVSMDNDDDLELNIDWQTYNPDFLDPEIYGERMTREELAFEVLGRLGDYYSIAYNYIENPTNLHFRIVYNGEDGEQRVYTNAEDLSLEEMRQEGRYLYIPGDSIRMESNLDSIPANAAPYLEIWNPYGNSQYYMMLSIDTTYSAQDAYAREAGEYLESRTHFLMGSAGVAVGLLGGVTTILCLVVMSGHETEGSRRIRLYPFDEIYTELAVLLWALLLLVAVYIGRFVASHLISMAFSQEQWAYWIKLVKLLVIYGCTAVCLFGAVRRYKAGQLWSNSLAKRAYEALREYRNRTTFAVGMAMGFLAVLAVNIFLIWGMLLIWLTPEKGLDQDITFLIMAALLAGADIVVFHRMFSKAVQMDLLDGAIRNIAQGNTGFQMDLSQLRGKERAMGEHINNIGSGLETALKEQVKSERLKTDLITNVSHDLKTPLTSIINYVDLIKREHIQDPKIQGYLEVLDQKSQRLKTLTEDLVEASKASSGNLKLDIQDIDVVELVCQTNGEFEEKFATRHLELISTLPKTPVIIRADGRRLWRILENLYNNAYKYAMQNSRIYVDVVSRDGNAVFTIKNVSESPLNFSPDELTERFVRGDVARTTEGSGLGLSIAKSLTQLQGGTFTIYIDGDLFKAEAAFPLKLITIENFGVQDAGEA